MDFLALSLPEAAYMYMGLAIQALVRQSSLRNVPRMIVLVWTLVLLWRAQGDAQAFRKVGGYLGTSLLLCILFWPEAVPFGRYVGHTTTPAQIASYAATQDPGAEIVTAEDTGQIPDTLRNPTLLAPGFRLLLRAITETPLALARTINTQSHRTFASLMPMQWLLGVALTTDVTTAITDWVHNCYLPVQAKTMEAREGRTIEELLPWGNTPLRRGLATREVTPGAQTGYSRVFTPDTGLRFIQPPGTPGTPNTVRCDTYLDAVEFRAQGWLFELKSPRGTPLGQVFEEELGMDAIQQARFLIYREMIRVGESPAPAPSLAGQYGVLRGLGALGAAADGASQGPKGAALAGLGSELKRSVESVSWFVGWGVFLTWWGPYIVALVNLVLIGLFPIVMLWALIPGTQFQPLAHYFVALLFTSSMPLWWALVDVAARLAGSNAPRSTDLLGGLLGNGITALTWSTAVTVLGILLVPVVTGILMFSVFRAVGSLWRGTV